MRVICKYNLQWNLKITTTIVVVVTTSSSYCESLNMTRGCTRPHFKSRDATTTMSSSPSPPSGERTTLLVDVERASTTGTFAGDDDERREQSLTPRATTPKRVTMMIASAVALVACCGAIARLGDARTVRARALGASRTGWLNVHKTLAEDDVVAALGVDEDVSRRAPFWDTVPNGFNADAWLDAPKPVFEVSNAGAGTMPGTSVTMLESSTSAPLPLTWTLEVDEPRDLWKIPVIRHGGGYRLGNIVERLGDAWAKARLEILEAPEAYEGSLASTFLETRAEGAREFAAIVAANARDKRVLERSVIGNRARLERAIVMPMRLSDKVRFVERNEALAVRAALDYRRSRCPTTCDEFIVSVSLVWGDDKSRGKFAYDEREYEESIRVLRSMLELARDVFPSDFKMSIAVVADVDEAITVLAYAPHLMSNPIESASTMIELAQNVNAMIRADESALLDAYDGKISPRRDAAPRARDSEIASLRRLVAFENTMRNNADDDAALTPDWFNVLRQINGWRDDVSIRALDSVDARVLRNLFVTRAATARHNRDVAKIKPQTIVLAHDDDDA